MWVCFLDWYFDFLKSKQFIVRVGLGLVVSVWLDGFGYLGLGEGGGERYLRCSIFAKFSNVIKHDKLIRNMVLKFVYG